MRPDVSCDFVEQLWNGESKELNNLGTAPQKLVKGHDIGFIEPVMLLDSDDPSGMTRKRKRLSDFVKIKDLKCGKRNLKIATMQFF